MEKTINYWFEMSENNNMLIELNNLNIEKWNKN